ncbi:MAG: hypothetical protein Kilf2KO_22510 [Rhodospirillales bacterium]
MKLEFHGSKVSSDGGLLAYRELDDTPGLTEAAATVLEDSRRGRNGWHAIAGMLRQAVFGRLAGYEDVNDAERLSRDPAMRWIVGGKARDRGAASSSQMGRFEYLEAEGFGYVIRLPKNEVLQGRSVHLLRRPRGRPSMEVRRHFTSFSYRAGTWTKALRVAAKVEWHLGALYPRVGFVVSNLSRPAERIVALYNQRGTAEQHIKEGKNAIGWTRLSCRSFTAKAVRLQLHALADNLANFLRTLALPDAVSHWSLTTLREKLVKIGAKVVQHGRYVTFQLAEVIVSRALFADILEWIDRLRPRPVRT